MLQSLSSLDETAERFHKSSEFIWNLSLQFSTLLRPELGDNGLIAYSDQQRQVIGRIIKLREQGMTTAEIAQSFDEQSSCVQTIQTVPEKKSQCSGSDLCKKNFKTLSGQIKFLWKQLCRVQSELEALKQVPFGESEPAVIERITQ
ncbi:MAG: helix-turn-helix domain-containing protein [Candidatus Riflebacteria bacterium]|nr:helix-turn-helix domain-containing protein [Candidatus Riflebacteria bacterium]